MDGSIALAEQHMDERNVSSLSATRQLPELDNTPVEDKPESTRRIPRRRSSIAYALESPDHDTLAIQNAEDLANVSVASLQLESPARAEGLPTVSPQRHVSVSHSPFSIPVLAALMAPSVFGVLARLGLLAISSYDQRAVFSLVWVQGVGCLVMGFALGWKEPISE